MQILIIAGRDARVHRLEISPWLAVLAGLLLCSLVATSVLGLTGLTGLRIGTRTEALSAGRAAPSLESPENLAVLAARLGELQARMARLEAVGQRVSGLAGVPARSFGFGQAPAQGGPAPADGAVPTLRELRLALDTLRTDADAKAEGFDLLESLWLERAARAARRPRQMPVSGGYDASGFGLRIDPFTGRSARHEGVDFAAPTGTPIVAAAGGVVVAAEATHDYGNMIDIDHGDGLVTRYAHASQLLVRVGDLVKPGQEIAKVGSTGRSTGPHLHFEVHVNGVPANPKAFLGPSGRG